MALIGGSKTLDAIRNIRSEYRDLDLFIETGTADAATTIEAAKVFKVVHSIELSPTLHEDAVRMKSRPNVTYHLGSSGVVLPKLLKQYADTPAFLYLDAHYCTGYDGKTSDRDPFPLWRELRAIRDRNQSDIVVVDDVHAFGRGHKETPDWAGCKAETICAAFHADQIAGVQTRDDQFIVWMRRSVLRKE